MAVYINVSVFRPFHSMSIMQIAQKNVKNYYFHSDFRPHCMCTNTNRHSLQLSHTHHYSLCYRGHVCHAGGERERMRGRKCYNSHTPSASPITASSYMQGARSIWECSPFDCFQQHMLIVDCLQYYMLIVPNQHNSLTFGS